MAESNETLIVGDEDQVRTLTLNRPDKYNALSTDLLKALSKAVRAAAKDKSVRCVVITGAGKAFCSGQDLAEVADRYQSDKPIELGGHLRKLYNPIIQSIRSMEKPVIAAVNGVAAGAGASLALACDMRIAAEGAGFIQAFINVGLVPDSGSTFMLPRLVGVSRAFEIACTGRKVGAEEAMRIGMVNEVVAASELQTTVAQRAKRLAELPPKGIGLTKRALNQSWFNDLPTQLDYEAMLQTTAGRTQDHREGVAAFIEKRSPTFTGK